MATAIGSATGVREILGRTSDDLTDSEAESKINEAIRKIQARYWVEWMMDGFFATTVRETGSTNRVYSTYFKMKDANDVIVYRNGVLLTVTTDYTVDATTSKITFTSNINLNDGDKVNIFYLPEFFDDLANYMAADRLMRTTLICIPNGTQAVSIKDGIKETLSEYERMIAVKPHVAFIRDHREGASIW